MNEETIKEAFQKVKQDIFSIGSEISQIRLELTELKTSLNLVSRFLEDIKSQEILKKSNEIVPTLQQINSNIISIPTHTPTHPQEIGGLISPNTRVSTGNRGVPTDRQTNQQTNQHINNEENHLEKASEILASLDSLKKEVRLKFKRLTNQEMQVFSLLYNLDDVSELVDYKLLADRLHLSESSIRDYIGKIQRKGIPITKEKLNNKRVILHISPDLKKIASLNTILKLREL